MELTATELQQRVKQEGTQYCLCHYYSVKELNKIKNKELRNLAIELRHSLEEFEDLLEEQVWKETIDDLEQ